MGTSAAGGRTEVDKRGDGEISPSLSGVPPVEERDGTGHFSSGLVTTRRRGTRPVKPGGLGSRRHGEFSDPIGVHLGEKNIAPGVAGDAVRAVPNRPAAAPGERISHRTLSGTR